MAFQDAAALVFLASPVQVTCLGWVKCHGRLSPLAIVPKSFLTISHGA